MAEVDFSDEESAKAWFEGQSVAVSCAISSRAALRVSANICPRGETAASDLALPVLRAILTSAGRGFASPADVSPINWEQIADSAFSAAVSATAHSATAHSAARSAARSARSAADSAHSAADSARSAAFSAAASAAFSAADSAHSATTWDSQRSPAALSSQRVWAGAEVPDAISENHQNLLTFLRADPAWAFWLRFYEGMWEGTFDEWDLAFEVIQIDEADWEKGYEHIGEAIAEIEAELLAKKTHIAETVVFKESDAKSEDESPIGGQFDVVPVAVEQPDALARAVSKVEDSFEDALIIGHGQHVRETSLEGLILRRVFARYRTDPHRVEMDFEDVRRVLVNNTCTPDHPNRNYPDSDELQILIAALLSAADDIRGAYPEIAEARLEMDAQENIGPLPEEVKDKFKEAQSILPLILTDRMRVGMEEDIPELINDAIGLPVSGAPALPAAGERIREPRKSVLRRVTNRLAKMRLELGKMSKKAIESPEGQFATLVTLIGALLGMLGVLF